MIIYIDINNESGGKIMSENNNFSNFFGNFRKDVPAQTAQDEAERDKQKRIEELKLDPEVQAMANSIRFEDSKSILDFGKDVSDEMNKVSEDILAITQRTTDKDVVKMMGAFTGLVKKFDLKQYDLRKAQQPKNAVARVIANALRKVKLFGLSVNEVLARQNGLSSEIDTIVLQMQKYELDIKANDAALEKLYVTNDEYIKKIEKYIAAGELVLERAEKEIEEINETDEYGADEKLIMIERIEKGKQKMTDQLYTLYVNKEVARQNIPAINHVHDNNFNLHRNVNMASRTLIPALRQQLVIGQTLQQQDIQDKVMNELKIITQEMMIKNSKYNAEVSTNIRKTSSSAAISLDTLKECQASIEMAITNSKQLAEEMEKKRLEDISEFKKLEGRTSEARKLLSSFNIKH
jgi:uncharacterized protein lmo1967